MFFVPVTIAGNNTIPIDHLVTFIKKIPHLERVYALLIVIIGAFLPFIRKNWNLNASTIIFSMLKLLGIVFVIMAFTGKGPEFLMKPDVIPFIFKKIVANVTMVIPVGSVFLAFLVNYGLMEFCGVYMEPIMKPVWKTPGRSAIDAVASFVGSYSLALLITNRVYKEGKYTAKEAAIIATGFSTVSATFMIVVAKALNIMDRWGLYFWLTFFVTFAVTAITARIFPLSKKPDTYFEAMAGDPEPPVRDHFFQHAMARGMDAYSKAPSVWQSVVINLKDGIMLALTIGPLLMSIGVLGILAANHTPIFDWLGYIFYPFTLLVRVPDALLAAKASSVSIAEMFLPAALIPETAPLITRFLIAIVSVSEILFFSASIPCMMATEIPLKMTDYFLIWVERVILTILITTPILHLILR